MDPIAEILIRLDSIKLKKKYFSSHIAVSYKGEYDNDLPSFQSSIMPYVTNDIFGIPYNTHLKNIHINIYSVHKKHGKNHSHEYKIIGKVAIKLPIHKKVAFTSLNYEKQLKVKILKEFKEDERDKLHVNEDGEEVEGQYVGVLSGSLVFHTIQGSKPFDREMHIPQSKVNKTVHKPTKNQHVQADVPITNATANIISDTPSTQYPMNNFKFSKLNRNVDWSRLRDLNLNDVLRSNQSQPNHLLSYARDVCNGHVDNRDCDPNLHKGLHILQYSAQYLLSCHEVLHDRIELIQNALQVFGKEEECLDLEIHRLKGKDKGLHREMESYDELQGEYMRVLTLLNPAAAEQYRKACSEECIRDEMEEKRKEMQMQEQLEELQYLRDKEAVRRKKKMNHARQRSKFEYSSSSADDSSDSSDNGDNNLTKKTKKSRGVTKKSPKRRDATHIVSTKSSPDADRDDANEPDVDSCEIHTVPLKKEVLVNGSVAGAGWKTAAFTKVPSILAPVAKPTEDDSKGGMTVDEIDSNDGRTNLQRKLPNDKYIMDADTAGSIAMSVDSLNDPQTNANVDVISNSNEENQDVHLSTTNPPIHPATRGTKTTHTRIIRSYSNPQMNTDVESDASVLEDTINEVNGVDIHGVVSKPLASTVNADADEDSDEDIMGRRRVSSQWHSAGVRSHDRHEDSHYQASPYGSRNSSQLNSTRNSEHSQNSMVEDDSPDHFQSFVDTSNSIVSADDEGNEADRPQSNALSATTPCASGQNQEGIKLAATVPTGSVAKIDPAEKVQEKPKDVFVSPYKTKFTRGSAVIGMSTSSGNNSRNSSYSSIDLRGVGENDYRHDDVQGGATQNTDTSVMSATGDSVHGFSGIDLSSMVDHRMTTSASQLSQGEVSNTYVSSDSSHENQESMLLQSMDDSFPQFQAAQSKMLARGVGMRTGVINYIQEKQQRGEGKTAAEGVGGGNAGAVMVVDTDSVRDSDDNEISFDQSRLGSGGDAVLLGTFGGNRSVSVTGVGNTTQLQSAGSNQYKAKSQSHANLYGNLNDAEEEGSPSENRFSAINSQELLNGNGQPTGRTSSAPGGKNPNLHRLSEDDDEYADESYEDEETEEGSEKVPAASNVKSTSLKLTSNTVSSSVTMDSMGSSAGSVTTQLLSPLDSEDGYREETKHKSLEVVTHAQGRAELIEEPHTITVQDVYQEMNQTSQNHSIVHWSAGRAPLELIEVGNALDVNINAVRILPLPDDSPLLRFSNRKVIFVYILVVF